MKNFKEMLPKVDAKQMWGFASIAVTLIGLVVNGKSHEAEQNALKETLKKEITEELLSKKN